MTQNIFFQWLAFHFFDAPGEILKDWRNFLRFNLNYFSILLLFRTLFAYWRKNQWSRPRGFDIGKYIEASFLNLVSRILGAMVRSFLIILGLAVELFIFLGGILVLLGWLMLPVALVAGLIFGLKVLIF